MDSFSLIDSSRAVVKGLGLEHEPVVLLVDTQGRIVYADTRRAAVFARFPVSRVLSALGPALVDSMPMSPRPP